MLILYTSASCASCRKAKAWLTENEVPFTEHNVFTRPLSDEDIKKMLKASENGTEDIISTRSKAFKKLDLDIEELSLRELFDVIKENPSILHRPILLDDKQMHIGFNEEGIRSFLPKEYRRKELAKMKQMLLEEELRASA